MEIHTWIGYSSLYKRSEYTYAFDSFDPFDSFDSFHLFDHINISISVVGWWVEGNRAVGSLNNKAKWRNNETLIDRKDDN